MYLVTGASGFVGRHLLDLICPRASAQKQTVWVLCRSREAWLKEPHANAYDNVRVLEGDVTDAASHADALRTHGLRGIFHLAAQVHHSRQNAGPSTHVNVEGSRQVARLAHSLGVRCVMMSTSGTVACSTDVASMPEEGAPYCEQMVARWPYYASKIAAERAARAEAPTRQGLVFLRPPMILGPGDHRFRSTGLIVRLLRGKLPFTLAGQMNFVDVREVAQALARAMERTEPQPAYHLPGHALPLQAFFSQVATLAGCPAPKFVLPTALARGLSRLERGLAAASKRFGKTMPSWFVDEVVVEMGSVYWGVGSRYAKDELGFVTRPAKETLADTVAWIRAHRSDCAAT